MPYADKEKQKEYVRNWSREYQRRKKAERDKIISGIRKGMANEKDRNGPFNKLWKDYLNHKGKKWDAKRAIQQTFKLLNVPTSQEFYDFSRNVAKAKHLVPTLETMDQHERRQFELRQFKRELLEKYVHCDPNYQKLTQEGQAYYEQSFLAFLDFLEKIKDLELLRRKEDYSVIKKIDIFHLKQVKEIMAELDKFLKKQQVKVELAVP
jgi:hypothetical protein